MRLLQLCLKGQWDFLDDQFQVSWSPLCREDLLWWSSQVQLREGVSLSLPAPDISFFSDASDVGWGALVGEHHASGLWLPHQKALSINMIELLAVQLGLQAFEHLIVGMSVALFCDNTTTVAYLRRSGGTFSSALNSTAREVLLWAENRRIRLFPQFIMGSSNVTADTLSRPNQVIGSEWTLHQEVVDQLVHRWPAMIDLFATSLTARLPVYFSPASDPRAAGTDALLQPWDDLQAYAFPPIAIIRRVLLKLRSSRNCELTLIAPFWPQRDWFPDLLELLSDVPITLSDRRDLLRQPHFHRFHQNLPMLRLTAWRLFYYDPFFRAKTESVINPLPRSVVVPSLSDFAGDLPERLHCPVRAVKYLRKAARSASFIPPRLFVSPKNPKRSMSKNAMSFYLRQLIIDSGAVSSARPPRAHDIRGIATSLNYYSNLSLTSLMQVATWKSKRVFAFRYLKEVSATQDNIQQFGPLVIAGDWLKPKTPQQKHRL